MILAIISTLAAMLLPSIHHAMRRGWILSCLNIEKQYYLAVSMYADDANGRYPYRANYPDWSNSSDTLLCSYIGSATKPLCTEFNPGSTNLTVQPHYYIFFGLQGIPICTPRFRGYRYRFSPPYWGESIITPEYRFPVVADANWGSLSAGVYLYSNHAGEGRSIAGANAMYGDGSGMWTDMDPSDNHYWYNTVATRNAWGYYGNVVYPIPKSPKE